MTAPDGPRRTAALLALAFGLTAAPAVADRAQPVEATVMIRVIGQVRAVKGADARTWRPKVLDLPEVEVSTGSGFIVSPDGWVVTNQHVIANEQFETVIEGETVEVSIDVQRIEVLVPSSGDTPPYRRFVASVYATDADDDLAILHIGGSNLPYVALGDSDALDVGDAVNAVGYPYGNLLEVARPDSDRAIPSASVTTGTVSAFRADLASQRRFVQVTAPLNPGNSGGPIVDAEGYVIGVAQSRLRRANAIGFGIPVNRVKHLLMMRGLDASLPVDLLSPGHVVATAGKGISIRVPAGYDDRSPLRLRVEATSLSPARPSTDAAGATQELALRIDRVASTQPKEQLERALLSDGVFEPFSGAANPRRAAIGGPARRQVIAGHASGTHSTSGAPWKVVYAIFDLGREKIVARYSGSADSVAANRSLLQASLAELEASALLTAELARPAPSNWSARSPAVGVPTMEGWVVEPGLPWQCATGLPAPAGGVVMSPVGDFTVAFRATWHEETTDAAAVARRCSAQPGRQGATSYATRADSFGIAYQVEGVFVPQEGRGMWQLELIAPATKSAFVSAAFADWIRTINR